MKNIFNISLLLITISVFSQKKDIENTRWIIKWNPVAAIDPFSFPTVQFAIERKISNMFSIQAEYGLQLYDFSKSDSSQIKTSGYKISVEGRFYPFNNPTVQRKPSDPEGLYTGLQFYLRNNKETASDSFFNSETDYTRSIDYYGVNKNVYGTNFIFGYQEKLDNLIFEPYLHIGYMYRDIVNNNREFYELQGYVLDNGSHDYFGHLNKQENSGFALNFAFGLRIGYTF